MRVLVDQTGFTFPSFQNRDRGSKYLKTCSEKVAALFATCSTGTMAATGAVAAIKGTLLFTATLTSLGTLASAGLLFGIPLLALIISGIYLKVQGAKPLPLRDMLQTMPTEDQVRESIRQISEKLKDLCDFQGEDVEKMLTDKGLELRELVRDWGTNMPYLLREEKKQNLAILLFNLDRYDPTIVYEILRNEPLRNVREGQVPHKTQIRNIASRMQQAFGFDEGSVEQIVDTLRHLNPEKLSTLQARADADLMKAYCEDVIGSPDFANILRDYQGAEKILQLNVEKVQAICNRLVLSNDNSRRQVMGYVLQNLEFLQQLATPKIKAIFSTFVINDDFKKFIEFVNKYTSATCTEEHFIEMANIIRANPMVEWLDQKNRSEPEELQKIHTAIEAAPPEKKEKVLLYILRNLHLLQEFPALKVSAAISALVSANRAIDPKQVVDLIYYVDKLTPYEEDTSHYFDLADVLSDMYILDFFRKAVEGLCQMLDRGELPHQTFKDICAWLPRISRLSKMETIVFASNFPLALQRLPKEPMIKLISAMGMSKYAKELIRSRVRLNELFDHFDMIPEHELNKVLKYLSDHNGGDYRHRLWVTLAVASAVQIDENTETLIGLVDDYTTMFYNKQAFAECAQLAQIVAAFPPGERAVAIGLAKQIYPQQADVSNKIQLLQAIAKMPLGTRSAVINYFVGNIFNRNMTLPQILNAIEELKGVPELTLMTLAGEDIHGENGERDNKTKDALQVFRAAQGFISPQDLESAKNEFVRYIDSKKTTKAELARKALLMPSQKDEAHGPLIGPNVTLGLQIDMQGTELIGRLWTFASGLQEPEQTIAKDGMITALSESMLDDGTRICNQGKAQNLVLATIQGRVAGVNVEKVDLNATTAIPVNQAVNQFLMDPKRRAITERGVLLKEANAFLMGNPRINKDEFLVQVNQYADGQEMA